MTEAGTSFAFLRRNRICCVSGSGILAVADSRVGEERETEHQGLRCYFTPRHLISTSPPKHTHKQHNTHSLSFDYCAALSILFCSRTSFSNFFFSFFPFWPSRLEPRQGRGNVEGKQPPGGQEQQHRPGIGGLGTGPGRICILLSWRARARARARARLDVGFYNGANVMNISYHHVNMITNTGSPGMIICNSFLAVDSAAEYTYIHIIQLSKSFHICDVNRSCLSAWATS